MAFNPSGGNIPTELGSELPDVFTDDVGFKGVFGDSNVQLLPTPWPADALPAPTCSLLAIAPTKGVVVGAGPDSLAITSSEVVRKAISASTGEEKVKTKPFQPQTIIPLPARPTHVAFASGDSALALATENGAQLSVFETASLLQGNAQPALAVPTNGATFRAVVPNPSPSGDGHSTLVALVTVNGELLIADLKGGNLIAGPNGQILKAGVSSVCWSNKGKQLVAGLADGTGYQMTPDGAQKDVIPRPPDLEGDCHISSISWLENDVFLMIYTPNLIEDDMGGNPPSSYYIITRRKQGPFLIQKMPELCGPFGLRRTPAYQFIARIRDYKPHLKDVLVVSSTASTDVGLITRADKPLSNDEAAKGTVNLFTTTELSDDAKRASLPLRDSVDETSVVGLGLDLSSTEKVVTPIQGEDILESSSPLPNILLLNNDGILCSWWFVYSDAIRQEIPYHGLASVNQQQQTQPQPQTQPQAKPQPQSAFGQSGFGAASATPGFGNPSALGASQAPALGKSSFGKPSFGTPSAAGGSFGQPSAIGQGASPFGKPAFGSPGFGQPSTPGKGLGSIGFNASSGGGFGSFASAATGGFASVAASKPSGESPFGKAAADNPFGKPSIPSPFGKTATGNPFGKPPAPSPFGTQEDTKTAFPPQNKGIEPAPNAFQLGSTFKGDGSAVNDAPKPEKPSGGLFSLDTSLEEMVSSPSKASPPAESMDDVEDAPAAEQPTKVAAPQPATSIFGAPSKMDTPTPPTTSNLFGFQKSPPPANKQPFSMFGKSTTQNELSSPLSPQSEKTEVPSSTEQARDVKGTPVVEPEEAPLPPDPTSKAVYNPGDTSASSNVSKDSVEDAPFPSDFTKKPIPKEVGDEAPLPTDFTKSKSVPKAAGDEAPLPPDFAAKPKEAEDKKVEAEEAPLPPEPATPASIAGPVEESSPVPDESEADEFEDEEAESERETDEEAEESDFADSGEDITHDVSHTEDFQSPKGSLESSFGGPEASDKSPAGGLFTRISKPDEQKKASQLFGEVPKPFFPPKSELQRSPSPVRARTQKGPSKLNAPRHFAASQGPGDTLAARKAALKESARRDIQNRSQAADIAAREEQARLHAEAQRQEEEALSLSDDDEDERLRADLSQPLEPVPTLDPFLPHQDYSGETSKPGVPGQIERLYRDINSMVDTLGINARSLASFLLYQGSSQNDSNWIDILNGDNPASVLDEKLLLSQIEKLDDAVVTLAGSLQQQRVQGVEEKLGSCRDLLGKDILTLRGQCASIRKTLDAHVDTAAIMSAPLSAEQANLQQDLRSASTDLQAKLADLEQGVSLLRARIADAPRPDGAANGSRQSTKRPTVEAVTSTIATMMNMAESKSSDIDVLEVQLKKLGLEASASPSSREGSPFTTPKKGLKTFSTTPGSRGSVDGLSAYHTPDSASRGVNFRSSITRSARASRLRSVEGAGDVDPKQESERWRAKAQRRQHIVGSLKKAIGEKKSKVRGVDDV